MTHVRLTQGDRNFPVQIAHIVSHTRAEGPGERFAIWFQGCPFRCPGCCNPEMLSFTGGTPFTVGEILEQIQTSRNASPQLEGITLLGGEPLAHAAGAAKIARGVQSLGLSVMIFTGYEWNQINGADDADVQELITHTDLLVDGLYDQNLPDASRRWIGSANQQIHFLTDRYSPDDACWREPDTLEIRLKDQNITINGFPARSALGLWKRLSPKPERSQNLEKPQPPSVRES